MQYIVVINFINYLEGAYFAQKTKKEGIFAYWITNCQMHYWAMLFKRLNNQMKRIE